MPNTKPILLAITLLVAGCATTQPSGLNVRGGESLPYSMESTMMLTQSMGGQDISIRMELNGTGVLTATERSEDRINWMLDMKDMHIALDNPMTGERQDSAVTVPTQRFTTDKSGKIVTVEPTAVESAQMAQMMETLTGHDQLGQWFSPLLGVTRKPGESWQHKDVDTLHNDMMGMQMRRTSNVTYTYDGIVDTLGTRAARVRVESTSMSVEGDLSMQGMSMGIDGDGALSGLSYYAVDNGVLVASVTENQMNMRISVAEQGGMVIPVTQRFSSTVVRK